MRGAPLVPEFLLHHPINEKIDERRGFRIEVVPVQEHFVVIQHLTQAPHKRLYRSDEVGVRTQRIDIDAIGLERREVMDVVKRRGLDVEAGIHLEILGGQIARLIEEAKVRSFDVETHGRYATLAMREVGEDALEQKLHGARLGRQSGNAGNVEMGRLRSEEEIRVQVHRRRNTARRIQPDGNPRRLRHLDVGFHSQRNLDVLLRSQEHLGQRHGLKRFLGHLPQDGSGPEADLRSMGWGYVLAGNAGRHPYLVQRVCEVGIRLGIDHYGVDRSGPSLHAHNGADSDRRFHFRPEMELMRTRRQPLGRHDAADRIGRHSNRWSVAPLVHFHRPPFRPSVFPSFYHHDPALAFR